MGDKNTPPRNNRARGPLISASRTWRGRRRPPPNDRPGNGPTLAQPPSDTRGPARSSPVADIPTPAFGVTPIGVIHEPGTAPVFALPMPPGTPRPALPPGTGADSPTEQLPTPDPDTAHIPTTAAATPASATASDSADNTGHADDTLSDDASASLRHRRRPGLSDTAATDTESTDNAATSSAATSSERTEHASATNADTTNSEADDKAAVAAPKPPATPDANRPTPIASTWDIVTDPVLRAPRTITSPITAPRPHQPPRLQAPPRSEPRPHKHVPQPQPPTDPAPTKPGRIRRSLALDGVRGIAVLAVIVYHFFGNTARGGYLGVDIFFVLSGFLITSLLVREYGAKNRISLSEFWIRRARRILPAALTVLVVSTAVAGLIGGDVAVKLDSQFLGSALFVNNWVQIAQSHSYFADSAPQIFTHYWSLAIEEQFYVVWPLVFLGALWVVRRMSSSARTQMRIIAVVAALLAATSVLAMLALYDPDTDPSRVYFGSDTHTFGLLIGVALALVITTPAPEAADSWPRRVPKLAGVVLAYTLAPLAFVGLIALIVTLPDTSPLTYQGGLVTACLLTAWLIHTAIRETGPVAVLLRVRPLRYLGERSFSLYLWHWPIVIFLTTWLHGGTSAAASSWPEWAIGLLAVVLTLAVSELSYRYIETPFRRKGFRGVLRELGTTDRLAVPAAVGIGCLVVALSAGSALGQSPPMSALEQQLDQLAQLQHQANASPPPATRPPPAPAEPTLPPGQDITGIGDSVMLASSQALMARFPGMYIDAQVSRHYSGGESIIESLRASGALRKYVVLGFGTNGQAFPGQLDRILSEIGAGHQIVLLVPFGPVDGIPQAAQQVLQYAPRHPTVFLAPWCQAAAAHPENLGPDGVHPMGRGTWMYADAVSAGLRQAVLGTHDTSITCPS